MAEGVFSRQDASPAPGPPSDTSAAVQPSGIPQEAAPEALAPEAQGQATQPTPDQIREWREAYESRRDWRRTNTQEAQRLARIREEIEPVQTWVESLQEGYQRDPRVREFVDEYNKRFAGGQPTTFGGGGVPVPEGMGETAKGDPLVLQKLADYERRLEQFERARQAEWADTAYAEAEDEFQKVMGRGWTPQEYMQLKADLRATGSINPTAQMYWTFRNDFANAGNRRAQQNVAAAQAAAAAGHVEGIAGGDQSQGIDLRTAPDADIDRLARQAIGAEAGPEYSPFIWTKPK